MESGHTLFDRIANGMTRTRSGSAADEVAVVESPPPMVDHADADARKSLDDPAGDGVVIDRTHGWPAPDISTQIERPSFAERQCSRSGCSDAAAVTLSYHYGQSQVWIDRLSPEREPHMYDMCDRHAERMSVPRGWHLDDRRGARRGSLIAV